MVRRFIRRGPQFGPDSPRSSAAPTVALSGSQPDFSRTWRKHLCVIWIAQFMSAIGFSFGLPFISYLMQEDMPNTVSSAAGITVTGVSAITAMGKDDVSFWFSANGQAPVEVAKCASGGEVSRIMLCLKDRMAETPVTVMPAADDTVLGEPSAATPRSATCTVNTA